MVPGPYRQQDVAIRAWILPARQAALDATCQRYLGGPSGVPDAYRPALPFVIFAILDMGRVTGSGGGRGWMREIDAGFILLTTTPRGLALFMPYLWVNSAWPLITGREVFGFRKELARSFSRVPESEATIEDLCHVDADVVREPGGKLETMRIIEVLADSGGHGHGLVERSGLRVLLRALRRLRSATPANAADRAIELPIVCLHQRRDPRSPDLAEVQAVLTASAQIPRTSLRNATLHGRGGRLRIVDSASHPLHRELGLEPDADGTCHALGGFRVTCDFDVELPR